MFYSKTKLQWSLLYIVIDYNKLFNWQHVFTMLKELMLSMVYNVNIYSYFKPELYDRGINYKSNLCKMILCMFFYYRFCPIWP